jgi:hypothetical protein
VWCPLLHSHDVCRIRLSANFDWSPSLRVYLRTALPRSSQAASSSARLTAGTDGIQPAWQKAYSLSKRYSSRRICQVTLAMSSSRVPPRRQHSPKTLDGHDDLLRRMDGNPNINDMFRDLGLEDDDKSSEPSGMIRRGRPAT